MVSDRKLKTKLILDLWLEVCLFGTKEEFAAKVLKTDPPDKFVNIYIIITYEIAQYTVQFYTVYRAK
jgi:hypothetical protein